MNPHVDMQEAQQSRKTGVAGRSAHPMYHSASAALPPPTDSTSC